ncbi:MAG TPA: aminotransferase class V-fold PLP-dependent enzyme [Caulobacteraceae bacterium]
MAASHELEPNAATQRAWLDAAARAAFAHLAALGARPKPGGPPVALPSADRPRIGEVSLPGGIEAALAVVTGAARDAVPATSPGFLGYIPGGGLYATALADFLADVLNRYTGIARAAPDLVGLENDVLAWLAAQFGYPLRAAGLFTSGGSLATFAAVLVAREAHFATDADLRLAVGYTSAQAHASIAAAFRLAGLPQANLRAAPVDPEFRMRLDAVREMVRADRARGLRPFVVIATAGSTNTGAIDSLAEAAALCHELRLWLHIDAAYGGAFVLCEEGKRRLAGIELADSITFDPHKGMFLPYGTGCLLLRDGLPRNTAAAGDTSYLQDLRTEGGGPSPAAFGLELTRPFRGLRIWLPLMLHGAAAFREALTEKLDLSAALHRGLQDLVDKGAPIEILAVPQLTVIPFRLRRRPDEPLESWNRRNAGFLEAINAKRRSFLSSTMLPSAHGEVLTLRACVLSFRTHARHIQDCLEDVALAAAG